MSVSRAFFYISLGFPSKQALPVKDPTPHGPLMGPLCRERPVFRGNGLIIHSYLSEYPVKELSYKTGGKLKVTVYRALQHGMKAYIQWGVAWFPKGIVYDTAITTPVPCSFRHDMFHLGLGKPEPH
jgi:hypothetical protein